MVPTDSLTRFLFSTSEFSTARMLVKPGALRPRDAAVDISVFRTSGQLDEEVWAVGVRHVLPERKAGNPTARIHGRADFNAAAPLSLGLTLAFDEPPPEHVLVGGWPPARHERLQIAQELAARAFLRLPVAPLG